MAELAISRGHREIVICAENLSKTSVSRSERNRGFYDILRKYNIPDIEKRFFSSQYHTTAGCIRTMKNILNKFPDTTLILTDSDDIAIALHHTFKNFVPEKNICITGFGNIQKNYVYLPIPSVEQHPEEIGASGVTELIRCIEDKDYNSEKVIEIETELVNTEFIPYIK